MAYEAVFWCPNVRRPVFERALADDEIGRCVDGWGRDGDTAVIADLGACPVGAAWFRRFSPEDAGYGLIAPDVPELTSAVEEPFEASERLLRESDPAGSCRRELERVL
jgi:hypothetical protein